jgi:hypothetical protein
VKAARRRFSSAPSECGRVAVALVAEGRRRSSDGLAWAKVGHTGRATDGPAQKIIIKNELYC